MLRALTAACLATATLAVAAGASTSPVRLDRLHGVRFELSGSVLTVALAPQPGRTPPDVRRQLWGKRIRAVCAPTFNPREAPRSAVRAVRLWPRGALEVRYRFPRDVSSNVKWCLLEDVNGGDVAGVDFAPFVRVVAEGAEDRRIARELRRYLERNNTSTVWGRQVRGIVVDGGVIAIATGLRATPGARRVARLVCRLIQGSDVADFTPGHTVLDRDGEVLRTCPARDE